jgi:hypothetical protein
VVLAPPDLSLWLPGMAGVRVVYGHPMETAFAEEARSAVESFFAPGSADAKIQILQDYHVEWIVCTEASPGCDFPPGAGMQEAFASGEVRVFAVRIR